ncbi:MAG: ribosome-binding factor A [Candidatus Paceibacterota bacterium]|jgi:ribosome-binding factor A
MTFRKARVQDQMRDWCAEYFKDHPSPTGLLTLTGFDMSPDMKYATILISVLPESAEQTVFDYAVRELHNLREFVKSQAHMRVFPFFKIELDIGEKRRQAFDEVLRQAKEADKNR